MQHSDRTTYRLHLHGMYGGQLPILLTYPMQQIPS